MTFAVPNTAVNDGPPRRLLLGPGPSTPDPRVLQAMSAPMVGHLDPYFLELMDRTVEMLRQVFRTANHHTIPMSGTGTAGLETLVLNLVEAGDEVIVGSAGYFGQRLVELAGRAGARVRVLEAPLGGIIEPERFGRELATRRAKLILLVHAETSTGALQPVREVAEIGREHGALTMIDCVTSLAGMEVQIDEWGIAAAGSCSQKCIGAPPGMGPITIGAAGMAAVQARKSLPTTWYFDLGLLFKYWTVDGRKDRAFHHTAPIANIYGFHEALRIILDEGLEERWERHRLAHESLLRGLDRLGLTLFTPASHRLPMLNVINIPEGIDDGRVRRRMLEQGIEISGGFGPLAGKVWRVGLMGYNAHAVAVERLLEALDETLREERSKN